MKSSFILLLLFSFGVKAQKLDSLLAVLKNYTANQKTEKKDIAACMNDIGKCYLMLADYENALHYYQSAYSLYEQTNNKRGMAQTLSNIGTYFMNFPYYTHENYLSTTKSAAENYEKALVMFEELADQYAVANELGNLGHIYLLMVDYRPENKQKSLMYTSKALSLNEQLNNQKGIADNYWILGDYYFRSSDYSKALMYFQKSLSIYNQLNDKNGIAEVLLNTAAVYREAPDTILEHAGIDPATKFTKAIENQKQSLQLLKDIGFLSREVNVLFEICKTYERAGNLDSAFVYYKQFILLRDKALNVEKEKELNRMELKYAYDRKEDSVKLQQALTDEKVKQRQKQFEQQLILTNKEKDLQKLAYLKSQADLQNEQLQRNQKEKQLTISEKEKQLQLANVKTLTQEKHLNAFKQQQQWFYIIGGLVLLSLGGFYFFYRTRLHEGLLKTEIAAERIEQQRKEVEFQRQLGDISLSALRSQMNPHFIFNCLNSIKLYTTQNDTEAATEYLSKFSKLIRLVMENSRNDRITLKSELDALRLYIEMEVMRFKEKLSYNINIDNDVETDYIEIPPLLLQPYVENAIWHGLMHKEEGGRIDVNVSMQKNESLLEINIIDNGIGRVKSAELRSKTATKHKSYGMKVTSERIALINQIYKTGADVCVHDLVDANGNALGTEVTIKIPV